MCLYRFAYVVRTANVVFLFSPGEPTTEPRCCTHIHKYTGLERVVVHIDHGRAWHCVHGWRNGCPLLRQKVSEVVYKLSKQ